MYIVRKYSKIFTSIITHMIQGIDQSEAIKLN